jgi:hypothetical protein
MCYIRLHGESLYAINICGKYLFNLGSAFFHKDFLLLL